MTKEKDVTIFIPTLAGGGAERMMLNVAKELQKQGLDTHLLVSDLSGEYLHLLDNDLDVISLGEKHIYKALPNFLKYLERYKPKNLISALSYTNMFTILASKLSTTNPKIISRVGNSPRRFNQSKGVFNSVAPFLIKTVYPKADKIVTISKGLARELNQNYGIPKEKLSVIYNPAFNPEIIQKSKKPVEHPFFKSKDPVILGVGRLADQKDFKTLIKSFKIVREKKNAKLIILGKETQKGKLKELKGLTRKMGLKKEVDFPGFVKNPYKYMANSSVFTLSSKWEGFGVVIVEAMATGTPVVSTDCPSGPSEILENGKYGKLVPVGDHEKMAEKILETLENPPDTEKITGRAKKFNLSNCADRYMELLDL